LISYTKLFFRIMKLLSSIQHQVFNIKYHEQGDASIISIQSGKSTIHLLGTVQGLISERSAVRSDFKKTAPDMIALPISESLLKGLKEVVSGNIEETPVSTRDEIFAAHLSKFGEVQLPPPSLVEAYKLSMEASIPCVPVDLDDDTYDQLYLKYITAFQYFRHIGRLKRLGKRKFKADNAQDFVREWDFHFCRLKGFRKLEVAREKQIAVNLVYQMKEYTTILAVIELEREKGIVDEIRHLLGEGK